MAAAAWAHRICTALADMKTVPQPPHHPRRRLIWIARGSPRPEHPVGWSWPPIGAGLLMAIAVILAIGIFGGGAAIEMFARYTDWLRSLASPWWK